MGADAVKAPAHVGTAYYYSFGQSGQSARAGTRGQTYPLSAAAGEKLGRQRRLVAHQKNPLGETNLIPCFFMVYRIE